VTNGDNDAEGIAVLIISPACPPVLVEVSLSTDSKDASWDNTGRRAAEVRGNEKYSSQTEFRIN